MIGRKQGLNLALVGSCSQSVIVNSESAGFKLPRYQSIETKRTLDTTQQVHPPSLDIEP